MRKSGKLSSSPALIAIPDPPSNAGEATKKWMIETRQLLVDMESRREEVPECVRTKCSDDSEFAALANRVSALENLRLPGGGVGQPNPPGTAPPTQPPGTVDPKTMRYKDDLPASSLPALPDPSVKYGDAWRISVAGTSHGIAWSVGDLAVVGAGNTYDRVGGEPYRPDLAIESFVVAPSKREVGNDLSQVVFSWRYNRDDIAAQSISSTGLTAQHPDPALTAYTWVVPIGSTTTFNLTATDSGGDSVSRTARTTFMYKRFWGTHPNTTITDADLFALNGELSTTRVQTRDMVPAGNYFYLAWPAAWGEGKIFAGGLPDTSWVLDTRSITNPYGVTASYHVYRSAKSPDGTEAIEIEVR